MELSNCTFFLLKSSDPKGKFSFYAFIMNNKVLLYLYSFAFLFNRLFRSCFQKATVPSKHHFNLLFCCCCFCCCFLKLYFKSLVVYSNLFGIVHGLNINAFLEANSLVLHALLLLFFVLFYFVVFTLPQKN